MKGNFSDAFRPDLPVSSCPRWPPSEMVPSPSEMCLGVVGMLTVDGKVKLTAVTRLIALFRLTMVASRLRSTRR